MDRQVFIDALEVLGLNNPKAAELLKVSVYTINGWRKKSCEGPPNIAEAVIEREFKLRGLEWPMKQK